MLRRGFVLFLVILLLFPLYSCKKMNSILIIIAEDQSSHLKDIHQSLMKGRTIGLVAVDKMNLPYRLQLNTETDTMNLPEKTANAFRFYREEADLFLGVPSAECAQVAKYISDTYQIPFITDCYDDSVVENVRSVSVFNQNPCNVGKLIARFFYFYLKKNKVSILFDESTLSNQQMAEGFFQEANIIGLNISQNKFKGNLPKIDFNRILVTMKTWEPEIVFLCMDSNSFETVLSLMKQVFVSFPMVFLSRTPRDESLLSKAGLYENTYCFSVFYEQKQSFQQQSFYQQYKTEYNEEPDYYAALGYDEVMLIAEMVQRKANQKQNDWFNDCKGWKTENSKLYNTGFIGFDQDGLALKPIDILSIQKGKLVYLNEYWAEISLRR